jgi:hypothetical protein
MGSSKGDKILGIQSEIVKTTSSQLPSGIRLIQRLLNNVGPKLGVNQIVFMHTVGSTASCVAAWCVPRMSSIIGARLPRAAIVILARCREFEDRGVRAIV